MRPLYGIGAATVEELIEDRGEDNAIDVEQNVDMDEMAEDASIVRFVNQIIMAWDGRSRLCICDWTRVEQRASRIETREVD